MFLPSVHMFHLSTKHILCAPWAKKHPGTGTSQLPVPGMCVFFSLYQMLSAGRTAEALDQRLLVHCKLIAALGTFHLIERALGAVEILRPHPSPSSGSSSRLRICHPSAPPMQPERRSYHRRLHLKAKPDDTGDLRCPPVQTAAALWHSAGRVWPLPSRTGYRQPVLPRSSALCALEVLAGTGVDDDLVALVDEQGHLDLGAGLQGGGLEWRWWRCRPRSRDRSW